MNLIDKIKNFFKSNDDECGNNDAEIVGTTRGHLIDLKNRIDNLNKANGILIEENKSLKNEISELKDKIRDLEIEKEKYKNNNFYYETKPIFMNDMPKQEPIRANRPKRNRNNHKKYYKKTDENKPKDKDKKEKCVGEVSRITNKDIPKPGSGDKVLFKNGEPIRRRRKKVLE